VRPVPVEGELATKQADEAATKRTPVSGLGPQHYALGTATWEGEGVKLNDVTYYRAAQTSLLPASSPARTGVVGAVSGAGQQAGEAESGLAPSSHPSNGFSHTTLRPTARVQASKLYTWIHSAGMYGVQHCLRSAGRFDAPRLPAAFCACPFPLRQIPC
jgi:hypothetical protein